MVPLAGCDRNSGLGIDAQKILCCRCRRPDQEFQVFVEGKAVLCYVGRFSIDKPSCLGYRGHIVRLPPGRGVSAWKTAAASIPTTSALVPPLMRFGDHGEVLVNLFKHRFTATDRRVGATCFCWRRWALPLFSFRRARKGLFDLRYQRRSACGICILAQAASPAGLFDHPLSADSSPSCGRRKSRCWRCVPSSTSMPGSGPPRILLLSACQLQWAYLFARRWSSRWGLCQLPVQPRRRRCCTIRFAATTKRGSLRRDLRRYAGAGSRSSRTCLRHIGYAVFVMLGRSCGRAASARTPSWLRKNLWSSQARYRTGSAFNDKFRFCETNKVAARVCDGRQRSGRAQRGMRQVCRAVDDGPKPAAGVAARKSSLWSVLGVVHRKAPARAAGLHRRSTSTC